MTLKVKVNDPCIQYQSSEAQGAYLVQFGDSSWNKIHFKLLRRQVKFPRILRQNDLEGQGHWPLFSIPDKNIPWCIFGADLVIPAQICNNLLHGQVKFPRILSQNGQNDLEGQGRWTLFSLPAESIPGCMLGANLVILAQICDELSCGQGKVQEGRTDRRMQATTIPLRPERPRGKSLLSGRFEWNFRY